MRRSPPRCTAGSAPGKGWDPAPIRFPAICSLLVFLGGAFLPAAPAGAQLLNIKHYSHAQGLPQAQIYSVFQDARGYIWVGSNAGLARYDGRRFHSVTARDGLASNTVSRIDQLPAGTMVAATMAGVCFLREDGIRCYGQDDGLAGGQIRDLHVDEDGSVWVASDQGVSHLSESGVVRSFDAADGLPSGEVLALARDGEAVLWAGTRQGLVRFDGATWNEVPIQGKRGLVVAALLRGPSGLLLGTGEGLFLRSGPNFVLLPLTDGLGLVGSLAAGPDGTVWAEASGVLFRYREGESARYTPEQGIPAQAIWDLLVDREGNVWMGSDAGLDKLVPGPFEFYTVRQGLPHAFVRAMAETADGRLWFGTRNGLAVWTGGGMREVPFREIAQDARIYALAPEPGGGILIGTPSGLMHRSAAGILEHFGRADGLPHRQIMSLLPDGRGGVWVATGGGVVSWRQGRILPPPHPGLQNVWVTSLARDEEDRLWAGLGSGGIRVLAGDSVWSRGPEDGFTDQTVWSLAPDGDGGMWAGTNGDGAFRFSPDGVRRWTSRDGLGDDFVWQVLVDPRGDVWLFTGSGLNRISGEEMRYYGTGEGLQDLEGSAAAALEDANGDLWFGTASGVYRYRSGLDEEPPPPARPSLESVTVGGSPYAEDPLVFPPNPRSLVLRFSTPTYRNEEDIRFRYRLVGEGEGWSEPLPDPTVSFTRLGPGEYTLEVVAETSYGARSPRTLVVPFKVRATLVQNRFVQVGFLFLVVAGIARIPALRARRLEAERRKLEEQVRDRTREMQEQNERLKREIADREAAERAREAVETELLEARKMEAVGRLAGGIAHDFNNLLTTVLGHADLLLAEAPGNWELRDALEEIRRSAQRGAGLVSELLAFSGTQAVHRDDVEMGAVLRQAAGPLRRAMGEGIGAEMEMPEEPLTIRGDSGQMERALLALALNARDAMDGTGTLRVTLERVILDTPRPASCSDTVPPGRYVRLTVADTGVGMDDKVVAKALEPFFTTKPVGKGSGLGLASVHGIVRQHEGFVQLTSEPGKGTTVQIYFPEA